MSIIGHSRILTEHHANQLISKTHAEASELAQALWGIKKAFLAFGVCTNAGKHLVDASELAAGTFSSAKKAAPGIPSMYRLEL